ncbi:hypothetical protein [Francisella sp. LA112445]|uniref:hypothetical protein n=1 Tax=Francisella sp. LA112445 TaxID=1395624 RepID=UPI001788A215|nr:hypothetical protein [Francisella sp. LA112445]QIW10389.1 hypothetical protein FIP56_06630 [Francisella sp. LA112445]
MQTYFLLLTVQIFTLIFAIRISSFKKDAWYFYFLATFVNFISFYNFSESSISYFIKSLTPFLNDLGLPLLAILIAYKTKIIPQRITKNNILQASAIIILSTIFMIFYSYINLNTHLSYSIIIVITYFFGFLAFIGSVLLAFGYILGLLISAVCSLQIACINLYFSISFGFFPSAYYLIMTTTFNILCFITFLYGYNKNKKLLKDSK